jgi:gliding motility-associated peptidyl-prolyl isomerase
MKNKIYTLLLLVVIACAQPQPRKPIVKKTSTFLNESIERNKAINKAEENIFKSLMKADSLNTYIASSNGFWYYYNKKDTVETRLPVRGDELVYEYQINNVNGDLIYSKEELGVRNYLVDKQELITGLQDGLKLMKEGEEVTFLFPSHKAYGYSGYKNITGNQPLIYKVKLKEIIPTK